MKTKYSKEVGIHNAQPIWFPFHVLLELVELDLQNILCEYICNTVYLNCIYM